MTTITEVAAHAGVSIKTVSRVINNYEHISVKTRDKVRVSMLALNYAPSSMGRQMRLGEQLSIGMLYGDPSSGYQTRLNHAILEACSEARRYLAVELFNEKSIDWRQQVEAFLDRTHVYVGIAAVAVILLHIGLMGVPMEILFFPAVLVLVVWQGLFGLFLTWKYSPKELKKFHAKIHLINDLRHYKD